MTKGEKQRQEMAAHGPTIYHYTSALYTNQIWMAGYLMLPGLRDVTYHPIFGDIPAVDCSAFGHLPLIWFTTNRNIPRCLRSYMLMRPNDGSPALSVRAPALVVDAFCYMRIALGFHAKEIGAVPWPEHPSYDTDEGRGFAETAREVGDNPDEWYVAERPVDILKATTARLPKKVMGTELIPNDGYLREVKAMVAFSQEFPGKLYIPPSLMPRELAEQLTARLGLPSVRPN